MNDREKLNKIRKTVCDNMFAGTPKEYEAFYFLIDYIDKQHDEFYNEVRIAYQDKEMSSHNHALYAGELREEIIALKSCRDEQQILIHQLRGALGYDCPGNIIENPDIKNGIAEALFNQIAEKDKEIRWLREERDQLESRLQHYRGYE